MSSAAVKEYIASCQPEVRVRLAEIRQIVKRAVPDASEVISYGIPTFQLNGKNMIHYGPAKHHVGLYATPDGHAEFESELNRYKRGKGSVQLSLEQPLPADLIRRIAIYRAESMR